ncbi:unnamed protein product [Ranitomeya imitator]|uniref:alpha-N-acetylgalactosaminide alpha-2,6-sialyltransferase n=1 Tax=Ranitomeya imitator TaxID=111125 RepID=A0ABN9LC44_9NEOB|nr:unnamed protein product [Ranitomeya imitator]
MGQNEDMGQDGDKWQNGDKRQALAGRSDSGLCWMTIKSKDEGLHLETSLVTCQFVLLEALRRKGCTAVPLVQHACQFVLLEALRRKGCTAVPLVRHGEQRREFELLNVGQVESSDCPGVDTVVDRLQQIWTHVVDNLTLSQEKAQRFANRRRCVGPRLRVGDLKVFNLPEPRVIPFHRQIDLIENYIGSKEIEKKERPEMTIQHSTESLQPEGTNTTSSPKPIESSTVTRKNTKTTSKPLNESIKLQNKLAKSQVTTQRPNFKTKPQNAITTKPIPEPTKKSSPSTTFNYLGNNYATDDTHVHSKCPNRIRDKLQSKEFQDMFLEKIPVLQWKKHAQKSEYERLKKYNGAQGWMGVTWEIINTTLNLLNSTGNAYMFDTWRGQSPCIRCAVVGNGGILNGSGMGQEIDSHDYVFRVNGAITNGFEKDVGNRTSFFSFSTNTLMHSLITYGKRGFKAVPRTPETRYVVLPDHDRDYLMVLGALTNTIIDKGGDKGKDPATYFGKNLTTEHFKILHPDFMRYLRNRFHTTNVSSVYLQNLAV